MRATVDVGTNTAGSTLHTKSPPIALVTCKNPSCHATVMSLTDGVVCSSGYACMCTPPSATIRFDQCTMWCLTCCTTLAARCLCNRIYCRTCSPLYTCTNTTENGEVCGATVFQCHRLE
jgi:hypothetical protein